MLTANSPNAGATMVQINAQAEPLRQRGRDAPPTDVNPGNGTTETQRLYGDTAVRMDMDTEKTGTHCEARNQAITATGLVISRSGHRAARKRHVDEISILLIELCDAAHHRTHHRTQQLELVLCNY